MNFKTLINPRLEAFTRAGECGVEILSFQNLVDVWFPWSDDADFVTVQKLSPFVRVGRADDVSGGKYASQ